MADIDEIISGVRGNTRADFSGLFSGPVDAYNAGRDTKAKNDLRDAFKDGVPLTAEGQPDFGAMSKVLMQKGALDQGIATSNLDIQRQQLKLGQDASANMGRLEGGQPTIVSPPSANRSASAVVAPPLNKGGEVPQGGGQPPQGQPQQSTVMTVLAAQGIPNDQLQNAAASVARQLGVDPTAPLNVQDPQVRNVLVPAIQQLKRMGAGQVAQAGQPQQQDIPPVNQNQGTFGAPPATPTRGAVPTGSDPEIQKQIATYTAIASNPAYPKPVQEAALTRLKALQEQGQPTGPIKEYDLYRRQGGDMPFKDFLADLESGKAGATERAKADVKEQQTYIDAGKAASQRLGTLNTLSNIISSDKNLTLGFGAETALKAKMALQQLGINVGDLSGAEAIQKLNASLASEMTKALASRPTQFEFKTFLANNPGLLLDKSGNERLISLFSQLAKREADIGKLARKNQDNWSGWDSVVENYDKSHPIVDPVTKKVLSSDSIIAPGPSKPTSTAGTAQAATMVSSKADYDKLPSGTKFTGPDGKPWQKP
jgi:hypothetical protein